jgi:hypothetical protein
MNCISESKPTPQSTKTTENNYQNTNRELGELYIEKVKGYSVYIPKGWEVHPKFNDLDLAISGTISEYNLLSGILLICANTSENFSKVVDEAFIKVEQTYNIIEIQKGSINIHSDLKGEYIKLFGKNPNSGKLEWHKMYFIPHPRGNAIMNIICTMFPDVNQKNYDIDFDKFVKTFNWTK